MKPKTPMTPQRAALASYQDALRLAMSDFEEAVCSRAFWRGRARSAELELEILLAKRLADEEDISRLTDEIAGLKREKNAALDQVERRKEDEKALSETITAALGALRFGGSDNESVIREAIAILAPRDDAEAPKQNAGVIDSETVGKVRDANPFALGVLCTRCNARIDDESRLDHRTLCRSCFEETKKPAREGRLSEDRRPGRVSP